MFLYKISAAPLFILAIGAVSKWWNAAGRQRDCNLEVDDAYRLAGLVQSSPDSVIGVRRDGVVWHFNPAAENLFQMRQEEIVGRSCNEIALDGGRSLWEEVQRVSRPTLTLGDTQGSLTRRDGTRIPIWLFAAEIPASPQSEGGFSIIVRDLTEKCRIEEQISRALIEKDTLLREVHHRVKNNMQLICSLLRLQSKEVTDQDDLKLFRKSEQRIRSLALVHEQIYRSEDLSTLNFAMYLQDLVRQLVRSISGTDNHVQIDYDVEEIFFPVDLAVTCGLIIHELVANSLKHREGNSLHLRVRMVRRNDQIAFSIWNSGGAVIDPKLFDNPTSLGLRLVRTLTLQLGGRATVNNADGIEFTVELPEKILLEGELAHNKRMGMAA